MAKNLIIYHSRKGATVKRGLSIRGCKAEQSEAQAAQWAKQSI